MKIKIMDLLHRLWERIDYGIRWACYGISPAGRLIIILTFFLLYGILAVYVTVSSVYNYGKTRCGSGSADIIAGKADV
jgi:hypothetical protein